MNVSVLWSGGNPWAQQGVLTANGGVVLPSGIATRGGDPYYAAMETAHPGGFDLHPQFRPFGIDGFWNRAPIYVLTPNAIAPNIASGVSGDPSLYGSSGVINMAPQVPKTLSF